MLDDAIDLLPESKLVKLVSQYLDVAKLRPDGKAKGTLLAKGLKEPGLWPGSGPVKRGQNLRLTPFIPI